MIKTLAIVLYLWSFGIIGLSLSQFENRVPLKPVLGVGQWAWAVLTITLLHMNRLNKTDSVIFVSLVCSLYIACNDRNAFFTSDAVRNYNVWSCQKVCEAFNFLLDNIYINFGSKLYRQIVGIPLGTDCAPFVADLFLFCYERDFMLSLSEDNQSDVIEAFNSTSLYLDDLLNIDNNFFDSMVNCIYPSGPRSNKTNVSDNEASFLDFHLSISDGFVKTKIYDKRDDFDFDIANFPFLDGDASRLTSYCVYISQLIRFARVPSHVDDFNTRNKVLTAKLLRQGYRYHKIRKALSKFYWRHFDLVSKYNVGLKTLLLQGLPEPEFYGDLLY